MPAVLTPVLPALPPAPLPQFEVALAPPDLSPWLAGNAGLEGLHFFDSGVPGPHVGLIALTHGNEYAGAIVLDRLLRQGVRPVRGRLTIGFANLAAFARFDPAQPTGSRCIDEDMNRLWDQQVLDASRRSRELDRARALRPVIDRLDILLDLHSMLWPSDPLLLCGRAARGRSLAGALGLPALVVADEGHENGRRLIDYARFVDPGQTATAILMESGQHWQQDSVAMAALAVDRLLSHTGLLGEAARGKVALAAGAPARFAEVTQAITATTGQFSFVQPYRGGDVVRRADTLIAMDGTQEIRTPHDDCLLIMPSLRPSRGHTAVRLARAIWSAAPDERPDHAPTG